MLRGKGKGYGKEKERREIEIIEKDERGNRELRERMKEAIEILE